MRLRKLVPYVIFDAINQEKNHHDVRFIPMVETIPIGFLGEVVFFLLTSYLLNDRMPCR